MSGHMLEKHPNFFSWELTRALRDVGLEPTPYYNTMLGCEAIYLKLNTNLTFELRYSTSSLEWYIVCLDNSHTHRMGGKSEVLSLEVHSWWEAMRYFTTWVLYYFYHPTEALLPQNSRFVKLVEKYINRNCVGVNLPYIDWSSMTSQELTKRAISLLA